MNIHEIKKSKNIAQELDDEVLHKIAQQVMQGYEDDEASRIEWKDTNDRAMEFAKQTMETKTTPWPNASNVKYPLITKASIDFAARTYPEIISNNLVVKGSVIGNDPNGVKAAKANNVSRHMSYQLLQQSEDWEDSLDLALHSLAIVGTVFKKTYYDPIKKIPISELCNPDKIIVNYNIRSLKSARRITHLIHAYGNDILTQIRHGFYRNVDVEALVASEHGDTSDDPPLELLEQHCYYDLDGDGYKEPYIVILHKNSREVLQIRHRFADIKFNNDGKVTCIEPEHWFTDYHFIRSHDGGFYSMGFGVLLMPLNSTINTIINQLIDSGTLNNLQSGFVGRGIRIKGGDIRPKMGEWKVVDAATGTNFQQNFFALPTKEPSMVLFQMLNLLIQAGKELTSSSEVTSGKEPPSNVPAAAYLSAQDQALKVLNAINKRLYKSLKSEFKKLYNINAKYLTNSEYQRILDDPTADVKRDYDGVSFDILPVADPSLDSKIQRFAKAQAVMGMPIKNPDVGMILYLQALELDPETIRALMTPPPDVQPPPEAIKTMAEVELIKTQIKDLIIKMQLASESHLFEAERLKILREDMEARVDESAARIMKMGQDAIHTNQKVQIANDKEDHKAVMKEIELAHKKEKDAIELELKDRQVDIDAALKNKEIDNKKKVKDD